MILFYAGIGARNTPPPVLEEMTSIAQHLAQHNFTLKSGGAVGADTAFEYGAGTKKEIYVPWRGYAPDTGGIVPEWNSVIGKEAMAIAQQHHPIWFRLTPGVQKLLARNVFIVLGSNFVICWTKNGKREGGTGHALRVAQEANIPIYDLAVQDDRQRLMWLMEGL